MQIRVAFALAIFLGSYLPLSIILLAQNFDYARASHSICGEIWKTTCDLPLKNPGFSITGLAVCGFGLFVTLVVLQITRPKQQIEVVTSKYVAADLMNYVLPYVVSFMGLAYDQPDRFAGFAVFLLWIFLITYRSGQIIMNPVLSVFGWRLYEVEYRYVGGEDRVHAGLCLSQIALEPREKHRHAAIQDVLIIKKVSNALST